ncbi:MAG TPA: hypothetical protein VKV28_07185 [Candidatus Binataceae bacterium]|nr:hypothetical protein [Candidatus Binataceae bacterium]
MLPVHNASRAPLNPSADLTGRLVAVWYGGLLCSGALVWLALWESETRELAAAALSGAVVILLGLASYTMRQSGDNWRRHTVVAAVGPLVVALMLFEFQEYNRRAEDAISTHLIDLREIELANVSLAHWAAGTSNGRVSGVVRNHSAIVLRGLSLHLAVRSTRALLTEVTAEVSVEVPPGQERRFETAVAGLPGRADKPLPCTDWRLQPSMVPVTSCRYQVAQTRAELEF